MGFFPCKQEPNICIRDCNSYYKYIIVCADNQLIASKDSESIVKSLEDVHKFKLKRTRCDFFRDKEGVL